MHGTFIQCEQKETGHQSKGCLTVWSKKQTFLQALTLYHKSLDGVDPEGSVAEDDVGTVEIPANDPPLNDVELQTFFDLIATVSSFADFGVQYYVNCRKCDRLCSETLVMLVYMKWWQLFTK